MTATTTAISWTQRTWNCLRGCSLVSAGCTNCYAMRQAGRFSGHGQPYEDLVRKTSKGFTWLGEMRLVEKDIEAPLHWRKPCKIFVASMSDPFHESVPDVWLDRIFAVMALAPQHTFQLLTKRPERMQAYLTALTSDPSGRCRLSDAAFHLRGTVAEHAVRQRVYHDWPLPNLWLGVSVENRVALNRLTILCETSAALRFASFEPLLEDLGDITRWLLPFLNAAALDWCIIGGESGPKARPFDLEWGRKVLRQCRDAGVPLWVKQLGRRPYWVSEFDKTYSYHTQDRAGGDPVEWPEDLRVQQFPVSVREA